MTDRDRAHLRTAFAEPDEPEAFARMLYSAFGGFVDWEMPPDSRSKEEYRQKARDLLKFIEDYRKHHGKVIAPPTPEMLAQATEPCLRRERAAGQAALVAPPRSRRTTAKPDTTGPAARAAGLGYPPDLGRSLRVVYPCRSTAPLVATVTTRSLA